MNDTKSKIVSDVEAGENVVSVKPPFELSRDKKRRYIRLEISEPIAYSVIRDTAGGFWPHGDGYECRGTILNLSAGGVLIIGENPVEEGAIVVLKMTLQDIEVIDKVLGVVKRVEADGDEWLVGVEFISREYLVDFFSGPEYDMLDDEIASFDEQLKNVLNKYVYYRRVTAGEN